MTPPIVTMVMNPTTVATNITTPSIHTAQHPLIQLPPLPIRSPQPTQSTNQTPSTSTHNATTTYIHNNWLKKSNFGSNK
jgi:hypothetical protein